MKNFLYFIGLFIVSGLFPLQTIDAEEGMWLPLFLGQTRYERMKEMGYKLTPEDIYSINQSSLKDAVVLFGTGCTGVLVSNEGLLLTNHHCGYNSIQYHSSIKNDYLTNGFWAKNKSGELPNPSLKVYFLVSMEDVTERVLKNVTPSMDEDSREELIGQNSEVIIQMEPKVVNHGVVVKSFFEGNQYILMEYEVFSDVRLVGAPPSNIGKFGGDTDNWVWPRHTADFSIFRIYANKENKPASYSADNIPYKPKKVVPVSMKGINEGDFTMVLGYPARTEEYKASQEVEYAVNAQYPTRIKFRDVRLAIIKDAMKADNLTKIKYAAKYFGIANGWKKWQGAVKGLIKSNAIEIKKQREKDFMDWAQSDSVTKKLYSNIFKEYIQIYPVYAEYSNVITYFDESVKTIELLQVAAQYRNILVNKNTRDTLSIKTKANRFKAYVRAFYKNYDVQIDKKIFAAVMEIYMKEMPKKYQPALAVKEYQKNKTSLIWADKIFSKSIFCDTLRLFRVLDTYSEKKIQTLISDPAYQLNNEFNYMHYTLVIPQYYSTLSILDSLNRVYISGIREMKKASTLYPDANQTFRVAYGKVEGYKVADGVLYDYFTTVDGIIEKENPEIDDYQVSDKLKEIVKNRDYGRYAASDGNLRVCFIASNQTSGGNSGSPVFNANGELIGLNFDRNWEGTMSDLFYDPTICRNISLDIRYLLFVVDRIAGSSYLIDEMNLVY